jgi:hypothetical protein
MKNEGVLVSLKAWTSDIEPYDSLDDVWIHMSGIPPRWSNWRTFRQISSSLGKMLEVIGTHYSPASLEWSGLKLLVRMCSKSLR